jgi:serine/threonine protein kinase
VLAGEVLFIFMSPSGNIVVFLTLMASIGWASAIRSTMDSATDAAGADSDFTAFVPSVGQRKLVARKHHLTPMRVQPVPPRDDFDKDFNEKSFKEEFSVVGERRKGMMDEVKLEVASNTLDLRSGSASKKFKKELLDRIPSMIPEIEMEVRIQKLVESEHIVRIDENVKQDNGDYVIRTEFMPDSLIDKIQPDGGLKDGLSIRDTLRQMAEGVKACHDRDVVHLDLKPENVFLKDQEVKISNFEMAMTVEGKTNVQSAKGSLDYMAPEMVKKWLDRTLDTPLDLKAVDIFALGVTFYQVVSDRTPFRPALYLWPMEDFNQQSCNEAFVDLPQPSNQDDMDLKILIRKMLWVSPGQRLTIDGVLNSDFLKE